MKQPQFKTHHHRDIAEFLKCSPELAEEVYNIMRYDIFHSTMDWVPLEEFQLAIIDAVNILHKHRMNSILNGEQQIDFRDLS